MIKLITSFLLLYNLSFASSDLIQFKNRDVDGISTFSNSFITLEELEDKVLFIKGIKVDQKFIHIDYNQLSDSSITIYFKNGTAFPLKGSFAKRIGGDMGGG